MRTWTVCLAACLALALPAHAGDDGAKKAPADDLSLALRGLLDESDAEARALAGFRIAARWPDAAAVARAVTGARAWPSDAEKGDVVTWKRRSSANLEHTMYASIPESYDPARAWPVLIWLHGGVSRQQDDGGRFGIRALQEVADEEGFLLLSPSTQRGAEWWTPAGVALVRGALADLARRYHVDGNRVAVTGFSDGASGCFHLLVHDPDPYCCFLPLMANPAVTRLMGGPSFVANLRSRPVYAINGGRDLLYPSARIKPMIDEMKKAGCRLEWLDLPEAGHSIPDVLPEHWETLRDFWKAHPRSPLPKEIRWETARPRVEGRFGWVEILSVDPDAPAAKGQQDAVLPEPAGRPRLGVRLDQAYRGPGLKLSDVEAETAAAEAGFEVGDILLAVDGKPLVGAAAFTVLRTALDGMKDRDGVFTVKRGDDEIEISCRPRVVKFSGLPRPKELGYGVPAGRIVAKVDGQRIDVTTRNVAALRLHLADGLVDLSKPVVVFVNGAKRFEAVAEGDTGYVLQQAVQSGPGAPVWRASILLRP